MTTAIHGSQSGLLINGFSMAAFFPGFNMEASQKTHEDTVLGNSAIARTPGLKDAKASGDCFLDDTATTGSMAVLKAIYNSGSPGVPNPAVIARGIGSRTFAVGTPAVLGYFQNSSLAAKLIQDGLEMITFVADAEEDALDFGFSLHTLSAETGTVNGTAVDNAVATANGGVGTLHVTAIAGAAPSVVVKIQHSTDNSTWVDLITFTATTLANTVQRTEVAAGTTIRRYRRMVCTFGGTTTSITFAVIFAHR